MARLLLAPLLLIPACGAAEPLHDGPFTVVVEDAGRGASFRGAAFGVGNRMWTSGSAGSLLHRGMEDEGWSQAQILGAAQLDLRDIDVRRDGQVVVMAAGTGEASKLFFSEGPGGHWEPVLHNPDPEGFFDALAFDAEGFGVLVGDPLDGHFTIFTSEDGRRWQRAERIRCPDAVVGEYAFAASGSALIASGPGEFWLATGGARAQIWHTESHGAVWFAHAAPEVGGSASSGWFGLGLGPQGTLAAVGGDYEEPRRPSTLALLRPGARDWEVHTLPGFRSAIAAVPERPGTWVAVGSHGADYSRDDGRSWQSLPVPGGHALTPAGPGAVLIVGGPEQPHRRVVFDR